MVWWGRSRDLGRGGGCAVVRLRLWVSPARGSFGSGGTAFLNGPRSRLGRWSRRGRGRRGSRWRRGDGDRGRWGCRGRRRRHRMRGRRGRWCRRTRRRRGGRRVRRGGRRRARWDGDEFARLPGVGHLEDRRVLQEEVRVAARAADPCSQGQLAASAEGERPSPDGAGLNVVHPDEIGRAAIHTDRGHGGHLTTVRRLASHKKQLRCSAGIVAPGAGPCATTM